LKLPSLLKPKQKAKDIYSINFDELKKLGITNLILDVDETLLPRRSLDISPKLFEWVATRKEERFKLCLTSNSRQPIRVQYIGKTLTLPYIFFGLKPLPFAFWQAMKILESQPANTAMIGDQLFMDILGANFLGIYSIFTKLITPETFLPRQWMRQVEDWLLGRLQ